MREKCGVFGISMYQKEGETNRNIERDLYLGTLSLQHRGQDGAGIAYYNAQDELSVLKTRGMAERLFKKISFGDITSTQMITHLCYAPVKTETMEYQHPFSGYFNGERFALVHNGIITNYKEILPEGMKYSPISDSEAMIKAIENESGNDFEKALLCVLKKLEGSFAFLILYKHRLYAARDKQGIRPLSIGRDHQHNYFFASETCAFSNEVFYMGDVLPGELVLVDQGHLRRLSFSSNIKNSICTMELLYFSRIDSRFDTRDIYTLRKELGSQLAFQSPIHADVVIPIPDSSKAMAEGYAEASGIAYHEAIRKSPYAGRSFIENTQSLRENMVSKKFIFIKELLEGKEIILIDDSIIRGTTTKEIIPLLKANGVKKIHQRVIAPKVISGCELGINFSDGKELFASNRTNEEMAQILGVDSLEFLTVQNLNLVIGKEIGCYHCFKKSGKNI